MLAFERWRPLRLDYIRSPISGYITFRWTLHNPVEQLQLNVDVNINMRELDNPNPRFETLDDLPDSIAVEFYRRIELTNEL